MARRVLIPTISVVLVNGAAALAEGKCGVTKVKNGWCSGCKLGYVAGVEIKSDVLAYVCRNLGCRQPSTGPGAMLAITLEKQDVKDKPVRHARRSRLEERPL